MTTNNRLLFPSKKCDQKWTVSPPLIHQSFFKHVADFCCYTKMPSFCCCCYLSQQQLLEKFGLEKFFAKCGRRKKDLEIEGGNENYWKTFTHAFWYIQTQCKFSNTSEGVYLYHIFSYLSFDRMNQGGVGVLSISHKRPIQILLTMANVFNEYKISLWSHGKWIHSRNWERCKNSHIMVVQSLHGLNPLLLFILHL